MITFQLATQKDARSIYDLMWKAFRELPDKTTFVPDSYEWICDHIDKKGFILIGCDSEKNQEIISYFLVRFPGQDPDNLGRDLSFSKEERSKVAHMESCVVSSEYRGQGLQQKLFEIAEKTINQSKFIYLMGTASPKNHPSCRSFEKSGYECVITKEKYDGKLRNIYLKKI